MNDRAYISGYGLRELGWKKNGFTWAKGLETITYDGTTWLYCPFPEGVVFTEEGGVKVTWVRIDFLDEIK